MKMTPKPNNTLCFFPFTQLALKSWNKNGIKFAGPCCNIRHGGLEFEQGALPIDIFHNEQMEEIRQSMLRGEKHSICKVCWDEESWNKSSPESYRLRSATLNEFADINILKPKLQALDLGFGDDCNMRCRMCKPGNSNKLRIDYKYFVDNKIDTTGIPHFDWANNDPMHDVNVEPNSHNTIYLGVAGKQWQNILDNINDLVYVKATGGETLQAKEFLYFIDLAIQKDIAKNMTLLITTNGTKFSKKLVDKLNNFKKIELILSIESIGDNYEYIRYPVKWKTLEKNLAKVKDTNFDIKVSSVLSVYNAHYITELCEYFDGYRVSIDLLNRNQYIDTKFLPVEIKSELIEDYEAVTTGAVLKKAINYLKYNLVNEPTEEDLSNLKREICAFDSSRDQSYVDYLHPKIIQCLK